MAVVRSCVLAMLFVFTCACGADEVAGPSNSVHPTVTNFAGGAAVRPATAGSGIGVGAAGSTSVGVPASPPPPFPSNPPPTNTATPPTPPATPAGMTPPPARPADRPATMMPTMPAGMTPAAPAMPSMPAPAGATDPTVPAMPSDCPEFRDGTISYKGLSGIQMTAGKKPASPSAPMVFYWHGTGSFAGEFATMAAAVNQGVVQEGGVLVSFNGSTGGDLLSGTAIFGMGDFNLTDGLFSCAVNKQNVDPRRVYATGCSAGGLFSGAMAAARSSYMAAVAPNSGGWTIPVAFQNANVPALMTIHGAPGVDVVIIDFSDSSKTADMGFKSKGGFVINCNHGGGHCGGGGFAGDIWKFFKAHPFGTKPSPWASALPAGFSPQCKIY